MRPQSVPTMMMNRVLTLLLLCLSAPLVVNGAGGELASINVTQMTPKVSYRQDLCPLYYRVANESDPLELKDALMGIQLRALMADYTGAYFNYDDETGIDRLNPGLTAVLLDELARRAGFTWRESFGIFRDPTTETWDELLEWSTEVYDISVDWWATNLRRINAGIAFLTPWYDSSVILVKRSIPPEINNEVKYWNWLRPFEANVWYLSLATIILSGIVYQFLEYLAGDRNGRSMWDWFNHNCYLSLINFTQASYEYKPKTLSGRIFGSSMAIWALVMTATYTANLASLLVDRKAPPPEIYTIAEAAHYGATICTIEGYVSDTFIASAYPDADRLTLPNVEEIYKALHRGDCEFAADTVASWNTNSKSRKFNPTCDMEWVGGDRKVLQSGASFAVKADSGVYCTGLLRNVINYHMEEMIRDGFLQIAWDQELRGDQCAGYRPDLEFLSGQDDEEVVDDDASPPSTRRKRQLYQQHLKKQRTHYNPQQQRRRTGDRRQLKGGSARGGAAGGAAANGSGESEALTMEQMLGSFIFHWMMCVLAVGVAIFNVLHERYMKRHTLKAMSVVGETLLDSSHLERVKKTVEASKNVLGTIDRKLGGQSSRLSNAGTERLSNSELMGNSGHRMDAENRGGGGGGGGSTLSLKSVPDPPVFGREDTGATLSSCSDKSNNSNKSTTNQRQRQQNPMQMETATVQELRNEIAAMRKSQHDAQQMMQDMQRQMLLEQWRLQQQLLQLTATTTATPLMGSSCGGSSSAASTVPSSPTMMALPFALPPLPPPDDNNNNHDSFNNEEPTNF